MLRHRDGRKRERENLLSLRKIKKPQFSTTANISIFFPIFNLILTFSFDSHHSFFYRGLKYRTIAPFVHPLYNDTTWLKDIIFHR